MSETDLRFLKFDAQAVDALKALGFELVDGTDSAIVQGEMTVHAMRVADLAQLEFALTIVLPNGGALKALTPRKALLTADRIRETCGLHHRKETRP
jgi:hypothetical protein